MRAVKDLGYVPNHAARTLAGQRTKLLGVVFPEIGTGFWADILKGLDAAAHDYGYHILTAFSHGGPDERNLALRLLGEGRIDALVVMNLRLGDEFAREAQRYAIPLILIDRPLRVAGFGSVTMDNIGGARAAMAHLYAHGHREVVLLAGDLDTYDAQQRLEGCRQAAAEAGVAWDAKRVWAGSFAEESGRQLVHEWLSQGHRPPSAMFCFNDNLAIGAMDALAAHGVVVPRDTAVVGFDDLAVARHLGLSTVRVPVLDLGRAAAESAIHALRGEAFEHHRVLPTQLIVRQSCGCAGDRSTASSACSQQP